MLQDNQGTDAQFSQLRARPLFSSLTDAQWANIKPIMHYLSIPAGNKILSASDQSIDLYWLENGEVAVKRETPFGEQLLAELKEDDAFGEIALIDGKGHTADVWANTNAHVWRLEGEALQQLFQHDHPLACHFYRYFWRTLAEKIMLANNQLKGFFAEGEEEPQDTTPSRPSWFAPPTDAQDDETKSNGPRLAIAEKHKVLAQKGLSSAEIDLLVERGEELFFESEDLIFREGDFGDTMYFILQGEVRISKHLPGVGPEALAILEAGEIFGEMAIVAENAKRSADSLAHENPVLLLAFRVATLNAIKGNVETDYSFLQAVCKMMGHRLREMNDKLVSWKMMRGGFF
jgi:CRP-like cAMP-binding protein